LPHWEVPRLSLKAVPDWERLPPLPPFRLADGGGFSRHPTAVRLAWDEAALHVRFDCTDHDAWGTFTRRDDPIYQEEAVEVFLAPGDADPVRYFELEVSPRGTLFDAIVLNPDSDRATMQVDTAWDCPDLLWEAGVGEASQDWWAKLAIPWRGLLPTGPLPTTWRANFYRIERPRGEPAEWSAWSPTWSHPADFHKPAWFGRLTLV